MLQSTYPTPPLSAIPAVLLAAFEAQRSMDNGDYQKGADEDLTEFDMQRVYATYAGVSVRVRECGALRGHDMQAGAILMAINDLDMVLGGAFRPGCAADRFRRHMDPGEMRDLDFLRETLVGLLEWHFENGAGALLPIADWLGLVRKEKVA